MGVTQHTIVSSNLVSFTVREPVVRVIVDLKGTKLQQTINGTKVELTA